MPPLAVEPEASLSLSEPEISPVLFNLKDGKAKPKPPFPLGKLTPNPNAITTGTPRSGRSMLIDEVEPSQSISRVVVFPEARRTTGAEYTRWGLPDGATNAT